MKVLSIVIILALSGCGSSDDAGTETAGATAEKERETVFDPMIDALDKAKGVEGMVLQQKQDMDAALKRMEGEADDSEQ